MIEYRQTDSCQVCGDLVTTVEDTGCGIDDTTKKSIFQIFGNASLFNEDGIIRKSGIGIGLTVSKQLVNFLNGQIILHSELNKGTRISFSMYSQCLECQRFDHVIQM